MKILVVNPHIRDGLHRTPGVKRYFPWGLATVMRCLEQDGHELELLDIYGEDLLPDEVERRLDGVRCECVCIGSFASMNFAHVLWLAEAIKRRFAVPVVVGGLLADLHHRLLLKRATIDFCVIGEGEQTAVDLLRNLRRPELVPGLAFRGGGDIVVTSPRPLISDLDTLPLPNFGLWNMPVYLSGNLWAEDETTRYDEYGMDLPSRGSLTPNISVFSGRGCPFRCRFCSRSYQSVRYKSPDRIVEEIRTLQGRFGVRAVHFYDELLVFRKSYVLELCRKIRELGISWDCQARVNTVDADLLVRMREAGCYSVGLGIESGSDRVLRAMHKGITRAQIVAALAAARSARMHLKLQFMCGYPGETAADLDQTLSLIRESGYPPRRLSWTTPLPGSEIYEDARGVGLIPDEEAYLHALRLGMNKPGRILCNVSGLPDADMTRLYLEAHRRMERTYLLDLARRPGSYRRRFFWARVGALAFGKVRSRLRRALAPAARIAGKRLT